MLTQFDGEHLRVNRRSVYRALENHPDGFLVPAGWYDLAKESIRLAHLHQPVPGHIVARV